MSLQLNYLKRKDLEAFSILICAPSYRVLHINETMGQLTIKLIIHYFMNYDRAFFETGQEKIRHIICFIGIKSLHKIQVVKI